MAKQGTKQQLPASAGQEFDPKYEWQENANSFVLRLHLSGFRKEDFRVQVDGAGRLTVRGQRADGGKQARFHKIFQLPSTSNLDDISGRFDAGVLTLTVPKRATTAPQATVEPVSKPAKESAEDAKPKAAVDAVAKPKAAVDAVAKPKEETKKQAETKAPPKDETKKAEQGKEEVKKPGKDDAKPKEDAKQKKAAGEQAKIGSKEQEQQKTAPPVVSRKEEEKPKADVRKKDEAEKAKQAPEAAHAAPATEKKQAAKPAPQADVERTATKQAVDRESLAEKVKRRAEEERVAAAAAAEEEAESARKAMTACGRWKERVAGELEGLPVTEWAEGLVETVKKNKEVIVAAVAAFSLGVFVSSRLFSRN